MVPVSALLAQAARGYFLDVADEQAECRRSLPGGSTSYFDSGEAGELLRRGRIRTKECELSFFGEDDQVDAAEHAEGAPLILSGELAQD
jgi:hypothetical protein